MTDAVTQTEPAQAEPTQTDIITRGLMTRLLLPIEKIQEHNNCTLEHAQEIYDDTASLLRSATEIHLSDDKEAQLKKLKDRCAAKDGWTDDRMLMMVYQVAFNDSSRASIANVLGKVTRNAVIGKTRRMGITDMNSDGANIKSRVTATRARLKRTAVETDEQKAAKRIVADKDATTDDMMFAERALSHRAGGQRLTGVARFAALHEPFARVNSGFSPAGPIHRVDGDVYAVAAHGELPILAIWNGDTAHADEAGWTLYAQTTVQPTQDEHNGNSISMDVRMLGQNAEGKEVYLIRGKTKGLMNDDGTIIPDSDMPDANAFDSGLKSLGLAAGNDDLLPEWVVAPTAIGPNGVSFRTFTNVDEIPAAMAIEAEPVAARIHVKRTYSSQKLMAIVAGMRQPGTALKAGAVNHIEKSSGAVPARPPREQMAGEMALDELFC